ncbi:MAG: FG-GAP repeat protein, partial [Planctomycetes bacterium]|nr:FG-GAP repeat protein [Planctomycetota bacterium]
TLYTFLGDAANDEFGWCIDAAGDVNADGWADVVVGARYADSNGANAGIVRVFSGKTGAILYNWKGGKAYDHLGTSVAGIGDVNADGYADILVGADGTDVNGSGAGSASVYSGKTGTVLSTVSGTAANDIFGTAVSGLGDVDADGRPDYAIGAPWDDHANGVDGGRVRVVSGKNGNVLFTFIGDATSDYFGMSVSGVGDVNKDGRADIAVGAPYGDGPTGSASGYVRVFSGANGAVLYTLRGDSAGDNFGGSVAAAGDVDNDGWVDLIVGAQYDDPTGTSSGSASVISGKNGSVIHKFVGDTATDLFGSSVSGAGDIDHDGFADLLVGATWDDNSGANAGSLRVFSGFDGQVLYTLNGVAAGDQFGYKVVSVGDVNKDGTLDFAGTSYLASQHGTASGFVRVWSPLPEPVVSYCTSKVNSLGCTPTISHTGMPKVSGTTAFTIRATNELPGHNGSLFYGFVPQAKPFQGGWLCIEQPLMRTTLLSSGGSGSTCNGSYSFDFNNWIRNGGDPALVAGELVCVQYWSRDPGAVGTSNTTSALRFVINP